MAVMTIRSILLAAALVAGASAVAAAQEPYATPYPPGYQVSATPPSWSYDPYTSGIGACVQANWGNSPPCRDFMEPTYGQPNYWPYH